MALIGLLIWIGCVAGVTVWPWSPALLMGIFAALISAVFFGGQKVLRNLRAHEQDMAAQWQAELSRQSEQAHKWVLLEASLDGMITMNERGEVLEVNPAAEKILGSDKSRMLGKLFRDCVLPESKKDSRSEKILKLLHTGDPSVLNKRFEITAARPSGEEFPVELSVVSAQTEQGLYLCATMRDITERQRVERDRQELLRKFRKTAMNLSMQKLAMDQHTIVVIADAKAQVTFVNNKYLEVAACTIDDVRYKSLQSAICSAPGQELVFEDIFATVRNGDVWHGEVVNRRQDGSTFWLASTIVPVPSEDGDIGEYITVHSDVTQLKLAQLEAASIRDRELQIGSRIQKSLLINPPSLPLQDVWISSISQASQGIDGDFVDLIPMGKDCVDIVLADVMGKGVPAALIGAATKMQLNRLIALLLSQRSSDTYLPSPADIVSHLHDAMASHLQELEAFVTMAYVRIDGKQKKVTWVGCGHEEPLLLAADGQHRVLDNQHPPIGVLDKLQCEQGSLHLHTGDALVLYTDGVTDAIMPDGGKLGSQRLIDSLRRLTQEHPTPSVILHSLRKELFGPGVKLTDDATMTCAILQGRERQTYYRELPAQLRSVDELRHLLELSASDTSIDDISLGLFSVACVEAFTNIVRHAQGMPEGAPIEMLTCTANDQLEVRFVYMGEAFEPPAAVPEVDWSDFPEGGMGMTIMQTACEKVVFECSHGRNTTLLLSHPSTRSKR